MPQQFILVVSDTLRADHMGCYGYFRPTSPRMDAFAAQGVRFARHVSQTPYTLPSFTSLVTGQSSGRFTRSIRCSVPSAAGR